jgi:hypothetical protein
MKTNIKTKEYFAPVNGSKINKSQAEVIGKALKRIEKRDGAIKPDRIVDHARPESSPLHTFFTWDDSAAAEKYRLDEASRLVRSVRIVRVDMPAAEQPIIRAFVNVRASDEETKFEGNAYISFARSQTVESYRDQVLASAKAELQSWARRYKDLQEFAAVYAAIDTIND